MRKSDMESVGMNSRALWHIGSFVRRRLPMNIMAGDAPSCLGVLRHSSNAASKFSLADLQRFTRPFMLFTALSARPLLWLLNGLEVSCVIPWASQNAVKGALNCGPLSDLILTGKPHSWNHLSSAFVTALVVKLLSLVTKGYPEKRSTMISSVLWSSWARSTDTSEKGNKVSLLFCLKDSLG